MAFELNVKKNVECLEQGAQDLQAAIEAIKVGRVYTALAKLEELDLVMHMVREALERSKPVSFSRKDVE